MNGIYQKRVAKKKSWGLKNVFLSKIMKEKNSLCSDA